MAMKHVRMSLLENAYDFLNEGLRSAERAGQDPHAWKFAVLHVVQSIELLLKARLQAEHSVLIYEDVDRRKRTVSLARAVERITGAARIELTSGEQRSNPQGAEVARCDCPFRVRDAVSRG
jgi:hypothetical protein